MPISLTDLTGLLDIAIQDGQRLARTRQDGIISRLRKAGGRRHFDIPLNHVKAPSTTPSHCQDTETNVLVLQRVNLWQSYKGNWAQACRE
jgi:hypothetical protein